jgi:hypothetical protein
MKELELARQPAVAHGLDERVGELGSGGVADALLALAAGDAERDAEVGLARADGTDEHDVAGLFDERAGSRGRRRRCLRLLDGALGSLEASLGKSARFTVLESAAEPFLCDG